MVDRAARRRSRPAGARPLRRRRHLRLRHALLPPCPHRRLRRHRAAGARPRGRRRDRRGGRRRRHRPRPRRPGRGQPVRAGAAPAPAAARAGANLCENIYFMGSASKTPHMQGGFATLFDATPGQCVPVPDARAARGGGARRAAGGLPARGRRAATSRAARSSVIGAGPIGLLTMLAARLEGAREIAVVDIAAAPLAFADRPRRRRGRSTSPPTPTACGRLPPPDVVFEVSGTAAGARLGDRRGAARRHGRSGRQPARRRRPGAAQPGHGQGARPRGSFRFDREFAEAVGLIADGRGRRPVDRHRPPPARRRARRLPPRARPQPERQGGADRLIGCRLVRPVKTA